MQVLLCGEVKGNLKALYDRVATVRRQQGEGHPHLCPTRSARVHCRRPLSVIFSCSLFAQVSKKAGPFAVIFCVGPFCPEEVCRKSAVRRALEVAQTMIDARSLTRAVG